jgi:hypothetical protein
VQVNIVHSREFAAGAKGSMVSQQKMWGAEQYWGLGYDWDPDWLLTDRHKELRATLIDLCQQEMRENAKRSDDEL